MNTFIYKLIDPVTKEIRYVGKSNNPKKRLSDHINCCQYTNTHKNNWISSLLSIGQKPILEIIEEVPIKEWQKYEVYWIDKLRSEGNNLTNIDIGGNGITKHRYNTIDKLRLLHRENPNYNKCHDKTHIIDRELLYQKYIVENLSLNKCAAFFGTSKHTIFRNITEYNFKKSKKDWMHQLSTKPKYTVIQYDLNGNFIKEWQGLSSIQEELGFNFSTILNCCKGLSNKSHGFIWRFEGDEIFRKSDNSKKSKYVSQIKDGQIVGEFKSIKLASKITNIERSSISNCCKGLLRSAGGYIWKYKDNI